MKLHKPIPVLADEEYLDQLELDKRRLDVLERWYQSRRFDAGQRAAGIHLRDDEGVWNRSKTLRAAADAEIARTTRTPEHE
jgi:hypothetical protein